VGIASKLFRLLSFTCWHSNAIGALQTENLMGFFGGNYAIACSVMSGIYVTGFFLIQTAPETRGKPRPDY
jgi:hypothetical protein